MTVINNKGIYIAVEGGDGFGKSKQTEILVEGIKLNYPGLEVVATREPGGCPISNEIRAVLLSDRDGEQLDYLTEAYLFAASRSQSLREVVVPVLERGGVVVSDRTVYSSLAYQGFGRRLGLDTVWKINKQAVGNILPDCVFLLDGEPEVGLERIRKKRGDTNRLDNEDIAFHRRAREGFSTLAKLNPERFFTIDGTLGIREQSEIIWREFERRFVDREMRQELEDELLIGRMARRGKERQ
jgi:dTMP kinase